MYNDTVNDILYVGGNIKAIPNSSAASSILVAYNGDEWRSLGEFGGPILDIVVHNDVLYVAGGFVQANGIPSRTIAAWDGNQWYDPAQLSSGTAITNFQIFDDQLYVGGLFQEIGGKSINSFARFDGSEWHKVFDVPSQPNYSIGIGKFVYYQQELYIAGNFLFNGIRDLAVYRQGQWQQVGQGIKGGSAGILDLQIYKGHLYVSGAMDKSMGNAGNAIQRWNGERWAEVGSSIQYFQGVESGHVVTGKMVVHNDFLYVPGQFNYAEELEAPNCVLRWDGEQWCTSRDTLFSPEKVSAICFYRDTLYAGHGKQDHLNFNTLAKFDGEFGDTCGVSYPVLDTVWSSSPYQQLEKGTIKCYPNPAKDFISIAMKNIDAESMTIQLYNIEGELILSEVVTSWDKEMITISLGELPKGLYLLKLKNQKTSELLGIEKVVKI